ncbi:RNA polymerase sigma factor [Halobacillus trueperi]|uniref:RNA polymerase sigma factor n=1 Tax=Halobacillus trueperi TaxID=156205 RepID=UPI0015F2513F|nr:sigma-70 family RNA polymerase sigma factor [Halobacillus trueperi]
MEDIKELYRLYSKELYSYLFFLSNDKMLAEELLQETFYQAYISIHRFKGNSKIKTWLYQIGKNVFYKYLKSNSLEMVEFNDDSGEFANGLAPENILEKEEQKRTLHKAIKQLKEPYKQVIILRIFNDLSFKEIGEVLSKSENWARVTFHRGKHKLSVFLEGWEDLES